MIAEVDKFRSIHAYPVVLKEVEKILQIGILPRRALCVMLEFLTTVLLSV